MKRHVAATLLALTTLGVINAHVDVEAQDGRYFGVWQGKKHDVMGWLADSSNRLWRDCSQVQAWASSSPTAKQVLALIREHSPPDSRQAQLISLQQHGHWLVAELNFAQLHPAVVLLRQDGATLQVAERAIWSGSAAPWQPGPRIRAHLRSQAQAASKQLPAALLACYDPASPGLN
jgi:hypothetical protein